MAAPIVRFFVPGQPVAKGRPRVSTASGRFARMYTPDKTLDFENRVRFAADKAMESAGFDVPLEYPLAVEMSIAVAIPATWSYKRRREALAGLIAPTRKPDADNVVKSVLDGMNGIVYPDDVRVIDIRARKVYAEDPGVSVSVECLRARLAP